MIYGRIYIIENVTTNDFYIGSTIRTLRDRFIQHLLNVKNNYYGNQLLYRNIRQYGAHNFKIRLLKGRMFKNSQHLKRLEAQYIKDYVPPLNMIFYKTIDNRRRPYIIIEKNKLLRAYDRYNEYLLFGKNLTLKFLGILRV